MRVVIRTPVLAPQLAALAERCGVEAVVVEDDAAMYREVAGADALWIWPLFYDGALVRMMQQQRGRLRWVQLPTMGYDPIEAHGIPDGVTVTNAGDAYAPTVAEHAVAMLLAVVRRIPEAVRNATASRWDQSGAREIGTLNGATVTIAGFGNIGREIATRLRGFGVRIHAVSRSGDTPGADESFTAGRLTDALAPCDAAIIAVPLTAQTRHLINRKTLAAFRPHAVLVNIARGAVIDHDALREALEGGRLGGAALDVTEPEPLPPESPLWTMPNVLITPHVAGYGGEVAPRRIMALLERNLSHFIAGRPLEATISVTAA